MRDRLTDRSTPTLPPPDWHTLTQAEVEQAQQTGPQGLSLAQTT